MTSPICQQCGRPAMYLYEVYGRPTALCLDCSLKHHQVLEMQAAASERQYNHALDMAESIVGVRSGIARFPPRPPRVQITGATLNHIHLQNSTVALLNTGSIQRADVAIGAIKSSGDEILAAALKHLAEAIAASGELQTRQKNEALEMLGSVATEASQPPDQRRSATMRPVVVALGDVVKLAPGLVTIWDRVSPILESLFR